MVFSAAVNASVLELDVESVEDTCHKLSQHHHMIRDGGPERLPDGSVSQKYEFIHALFRSVFYQRLTPVRRAKLHHRFGELIEERLQDRRAEIAAELGGHYEQAGDFSKAVEYVCLTAQNAWRRFAYAEAIIICERGLLITERLPENERIAWEMRFPKCVPCSRWHRTNPLARCRRWKHWPLAPPGMAWRRLRLAHSFIKWSSGRAVILAPVFRSWIACGRCLPSTRVH